MIDVLSEDLATETLVPVILDGGGAIYRVVDVDVMLRWDGGPVRHDIPQCLFGSLGHRKRRTDPRLSESVACGRDKE